MKTRIKINVTRQDIKIGYPGASASCPIALATKRAIKDAEGIHITTLGTFKIARDGISYNFYSFKLPEKAGRFIDKFDDKGKEAVKPFSFIANIKNRK